MAVTALEDGNEEGPVNDQGDENPDTFRQGVIESRLLIDAMSTLSIDPATLGACAGPTLPAGETAFRFDTDHFVALGQSI